jgi:hypothetical protein
MTLGPELSRHALAAALGLSSSDPPTTANGRQRGRIACLRRDFAKVELADAGTRLDEHRHAAARLPRGRSATARSKRSFSISIRRAVRRWAWRKLRKLIFDARAAKPIYAFAAGLAASAAYWIGSAAKEMLRVPVVDRRLDRRCLDAYRIRQGAGRRRRRRHRRALRAEQAALEPVRKARRRSQGHACRKFVSDVGNQFELDVARNRGVTQATVKVQIRPGQHLHGRPKLPSAASSMEC